MQIKIEFYIIISILICARAYSFESISLADDNATSVVAEENIISVKSKSQNFKYSLSDNRLDLISISKCKNFFHTNLASCNKYLPPLDPLKKVVNSFNVMQCFGGNKSSDEFSEFDSRISEWQELDKNQKISLERLKKKKFNCGQKECTETELEHAYNELKKCLKDIHENILSDRLSVVCSEKNSLNTCSISEKKIYFFPFNSQAKNSILFQLSEICGYNGSLEEILKSGSNNGGIGASFDAATATLANQHISVPEPPKTIPCPNCQQNLQQIRQAQADGTWDSNPQLRSSLLAPFRQAAKTISAALAPTVAGASTSTSANTSSSISKRGGQSANNSRASSDLNSLGVNAQSNRPSVANGNRISFNSDGSSSERSSNDSSSSGTASRDSLGRLTNSRSPADDGSTQNGNTNSDAANSGRSRGNESGTTANAAGSDSTGSNGSGTGSATGGSASGNGIGGSSNSGLASNTFAGNSKYTNEQNDIIQRIYEPKSVTPSQFVKTQQIKSALANNSIRVTFTDGSPSLGASAKTAEIIIVVKKDPATKSEKLQIIENSK